jgi:hypothetical protein
VGEFVAATHGLGCLLSFGQSTYNAAPMFALIFLILVVVLLILSAGCLNISCAGSDSVAFPILDYPCVHYDILSL